MIKILLDNFNPENRPFVWLTSAFILAFVIAYKGIETFYVISTPQPVENDDVNDSYIHSLKEN